MKHGRVLIASREANVRLALRKAMEQSRLDLEFEEAENGLDAVSRAAHTRFALIFIDIDEPSGIEKAWSLLTQGSNERVVVLTSHRDVGDTAKTMRLGALDVLEKPVTPAEVTQSIETWVGKERLRFRGRISLRSRGADVAPINEGFDSRSPAPAFQSEFENPSYAECLDRARRAIMNRDTANARGWLRRGINIDTERADVYNLLGVLSEVEHDAPQALKYYRAAIALDPMYEPPRKNLHRLTGLHSIGAKDLGTGNAK
ncbi:MAG TPA: response regulator [Spirochaetia bacterium]|nr:response regulator [Spirochaetia bacterium]